MSGELNFEMDRERGFICVRGTGMWTPEQASVHFVKLRQAIGGLRAIRQPVLVLVDLTGALVQTAGVAEAVSHGTARIYNDADFVALVAASVLLGLQMKHAAKVPNFAVFSEMDLALEWLAARRAEMHV
jgi:hypothetical protein